MKKLIFTLFILSIFSTTPKIYSGYFFPNHNKLKIYVIQDLISIKDLILLKKNSNEEIHDYLILKDWVYESTESKSKGGSILPTEVQTITYKHSYNDIKILITKIMFYTNSKRQEIYKTEKGINIITEKPYEYKIIINDLYKNNFKISGKETQLAIIEIASMTDSELTYKMKREYINTQTSMRSYSNGKDKLKLLTQVFEKYGNNGNLLRYNRYTLTIAY
jgi:hypothetical protein